MSRYILAAFAFALAWPQHAAATDPPEDQGRLVRNPTLSAVRLGEAEIRIDGRLDEAAWAAAEIAHGFSQSYPNPGSEPTERTEARILVDDQNLYVAVRTYDSRPDSIAAPVARRDATGLYSDWLHLLIDSRMDRRTAFRFSVNPRGVQRDVYTFEDGQEDGSWDAVWESAAQIDEEGWIVEYRIPLSQLRFGQRRGEARTWGVQIMRDVARRGERASWAPWTRDDAGFVSRFGTLTGLDGIGSARAMELMPYASSRLNRGPVEGGNPFARATDAGFAVGGDLRLGVPGGLTFSATANPDFGQVEADPAEVNLTVFETFLEERRPFFTEASDIFRFGETRAFNRYGSQEFFYSRRIGRSPQRVLAGPGYAYVDAPSQTGILGAGKISGRTSGGWSVGVMNAVTDREVATFADADGSTGVATVEPLSNYLVGRVRRDLRGGESTVGILGTSTLRQLGDVDLRAGMHESASLAGVDFLHTWAGRAWSVSGYLAGSRVTGSPEAIAATQRRAARYYQRPDAGHLALDPTRTALDGHMSEVSLAYARQWMASLQLKQTSPGFEINDLGFQGRVDARSVAALLGRRVNQPSSLFRDHNYQAWAFHVRSYGGDRVLEGASVGAGATLHNFWAIRFQAGARPEYVNDRLTRGGPAAASPPQLHFSAGFDSDTRRMVSITGDFGLKQDAEGWRERTAKATVEVRPSTALRLSFGPSLQHHLIPAQYVGTFGDPAASATYGARYLFGELDQTTASIETRLDWTFRPDLSLQLFAQPFVSAGHFSGYKEFSAPGTFIFAEYGKDVGSICRFGDTFFVDPLRAGTCPERPPAAGDRNFTVRFADPAFNIRSLRGNAVLRWEYRPGSALFLVWQQERSAPETVGDFDLRGDMGAIFRERARNVFMAKASYWLGR
jgi:hypothetical protein